MFAVLSASSRRWLGWLTALAGSVKSHPTGPMVPTGAANVIHALGRGLFTVDFHTLLGSARLIVIAVSLRCCGGGSGATTGPLTGRMVDADRGAVVP